MTVYPEPYAVGRWSQDIYYHLLNCGFRIPPTATSGSGWLMNPVGYNRVYVYIDGEMTYERWWEALEFGRVVVTNGPLLRPSVHGHAPGHVFRADSMESVRLKIDLQLATRDPVEYLEVVKNGKVAHAVRLDDWAAAHGHLPDLEFAESGWFLVRAVTSDSKSYRVGSTGPYYVEIGGVSRVSKASAQFFLDWVYDRARNIDVQDRQKRREVLQYHRAARDFWQRLLDRADAK